MADRSITYNFKANFADFKAQMGAAQGAVSDFAGQLNGLDETGESMRDALSGIADTAGKVGLAATGGLALAAKAAMDWESAWTGVLKTVDGTDAELDKLETGLRDLAKETGFAHDEVAAVAEAAGQLGISTSGVEDFTKTMLDMGVSTSMSSEEAATGLARLRNIMGTTEGEIRNTGSAMVALGNNFATTEGEILAMSLRLAGAGRQAGLSTSDVLGLATAMSSVGIEAEAGGTAMSLTMKRIGAEVENGGAKLELFARTAGMSVEDFKRAWGEDAPGALTAFVAGLGEADKMGKSTNAVLKELGITGIREADALLRLSGNAEGLADALDKANEGFRENNALTEESGKFYDTTAQTVAQAWAAIKDAAIDAGAVLLPIISTAADSVAALAGAFQALPDPIKNASVGLVGMAAVLGTSIWALSRAVNGWAAMRTNLAALGLMGAKGGGAGGPGGPVPIVGRINAARGSFGQLRKDLSLVSRSYLVAGANTEKVIQAQKRAATTMGQYGAAAVKTGALVGGLAVASGALGDSFALQNTAMLGMIGLMGGGVGAAFGLAIGGILDFKNAMSEAELSIEDFQTAIDSLDVGGVLDILGELRAARDDIRSLSDDGGDPLGLLGDLDDQASERIRLAEERVKEFKAAADAATESSGDFAGGLDDIGLAAASADPEIAKMGEQIQRARNDIAKMLGSFVDLKAGIDDGKFNFGEWIAALEESSRAIRRFRKNAEKALERGVSKGLVDELQSMGAEGALQLAYLANASEKEIGRTVKAWEKVDGQTEKTVDQIAAGRDDIVALTDALNGLAEVLVTPEVDVDTSEAESGLNMVEKFLGVVDKTTATPKVNADTSSAKTELQGIIALLNDAARDRTATIRINQHRVNSGVPIADGSRGGITRATGGPVYGPGTATSDSIPAWLSNGEFVIQASAVDKYGLGLLHAINAERFAGGGQAGKGNQKTIGALNFASLPELRTAAMSLKQLNAALKQSQRALTRETNQRDAVASKLAELRSSTTDRFRTDLSGERNAWSSGGGIGDLTAQLLGDTAQANAFKASVAQLKAKGLTGGALADLLDGKSASQAAMYAASSKADLARFQAAYSGNQAASAQAGAYTANAAFLKESTLQTKQLTAVANRVSRVEQAIKVENAANRKAAKKGAGNAARNRKKK